MSVALLVHDPAPWFIRQDSFCNDPDEDEFDDEDEYDDDLDDEDDDYVEANNDCDCCCYVNVDLR